MASSSGASVVAPWLTTVPNARAGRPGPGLTPRDAITVSPGQQLRIYGYGYQTARCTNHDPPARPFTDLTVFVTQGHRQQALATVSATPGGTFVVTVRLPAGLGAGPATVETSQPVESSLHLHVD
jgi:hypothetical protein